MNNVPIFLLPLATGDPRVVSLSRGGHIKPVAFAFQILASALVC